MSDCAPGSPRDVPEAGAAKQLLIRALQRQGERSYAEAESCYLAYLHAQPDDAQARAAYAGLLATQGKTAQAIDNYRRALEINPGFAEAASNLALALAKCEEFEAAEEWLRHALAIRPDMLAARLNLGAVQQELGKLEESAESFEQAVRRSPESAVARFNLANGYARLFRMDEALASYRAAIAIDPDFVDPHWNLSHALLLQGQFAEGWEKYEYRWRIASAEKPEASARLWSGEDLSGKRLFLWSEQGYGDTLQFIRYVPLAAKRGARVIVHARAPLTRILQSVEGIERLGLRGDPVPEYDYQCPLMSLPRAFMTTGESIPWQGPYLRADPVQAAAWRGRLNRKARLRVGLVWSSGIRAYNREVFHAGITRSITLGQLNPLARVRGVQFVSLQVGPQAGEAAAPPHGMRLVDWSGELRDFADTGALIEALDLVIAVDTAVLHLAGGLGKPVWVLLKYHGCWRWLRERADSPWYPRLRLFRQREPENWVDPIREVAEALAEMADSETKGGNGWRSLINRLRPRPN